MACIGIFDSGIGGKALARALRYSFPKDEILVVDDRLNAPYGTKKAQEIIDLTEKAIKPLLNHRCEVVVIACNTATAYAIDYLRQKYPDQLFVGIEPMIKEAARLTHTKVITVCATPATLKSERYGKLKKRLAVDIEVWEPDCSAWAKMIEDNAVNEKHIGEIIVSSLEKNSDVIVLGCTHYHWIKDLITDLAQGKATILEPSGAIAARVKAVLQARESGQPV